MIKLKVILGTLFLMLQVPLFAQDQAQPFKREEYCTVRLIGKAFSKKVWAEVDYLEERKPLRDSTGNEAFNSRASVMNFLGRQGWILVTYYKEDSEVYLIFRRKLLPESKVL